MTAPTRAEALRVASARAAEAGAAAVAAPWRGRLPAVPRLSVVVATCDRPLLLVQCLDALRSQTFDAEAFEIVIVDDGCCDATRTLVVTLAAEAAAPVVRYLRPPDTRRGAAQARNLGWLAASGDVIAFTDDDTIPAPDWLERGAAALGRGDGSRPWTAMGGRVVAPAAAPQTMATARAPDGAEPLAFCTANAFVQREALLEVGGFDERFSDAGREGPDLQFSLEQTRGPVGRCDDAVVVQAARCERWGASLHGQRQAFFDALLYAKHPQRYREHLSLPTPWDNYAIVLLGLATLALWAAGIGGSAFVSGAIASGLVIRLALRRLRGAAKGIDHAAELLLTSAVIPFLAVYWRLRGALHFRVWFF